MVLIAIVIITAFMPATTRKKPIKVASTIRPLRRKGSAVRGRTGAVRSTGMMKAPQQDMACPLRAR